MLKNSVSRWRYWREDAIRRKNRGPLKVKWRGLHRFKWGVNCVILARRICCGVDRVCLTQQESILFFLDIPSGNKTNIPSARSTPSQHSGSDCQEDADSLLAQDILSKSPINRSDADIKKLAESLRSFGRFAGLTDLVQRHICRRAWFATFEMSQIVCRQGQKADTFYLILSGLAISRYTEESDNAVDHGRRRQRASFLRKGDVIGDEDLLLMARRKHTVVVKDRVSVLGLDRDDFLDIFYNVDEEMSNCQAFLGEIDSLRQFPRELLRLQKRSCRVRQFAKNTVIVRNSKESDSVYVLKSGSCSVCKAVMSKSGFPDSRLGRASSLKSHHSQSKSGLPDSRLGRASSLKSQHGQSKSGFQDSRLGRASSLKSQHGQSKSGFQDSRLGRASSLKSQHSQSTDCSPSQSVGDVGLLGLLPPLSPAGSLDLDYRELGSRYELLTTGSYSDDVFLPSISPGGDQNMVTQSFAVSDSGYGSTISEDEMTLSSVSAMSPMMTSRNGSPSGSLGGSRASGASTVLAKLDVLMEKDIFGLHSLIYEDTPSFSLVSRGSECIAISKKWLRDHMDTSTVESLQKMLRPYPSQSQLRNAVDDHFRCDPSRSRVSLTSVMTSRRRLNSTD